MIWSDWQAFLAMGGYGPYVWGAFGMAAFAMAAETLSLRGRRRAAMAQYAIAASHDIYAEATHEG